MLLNSTWPLPHFPALHPLKLLTANACVRWCRPYFLFYVEGKLNHRKVTWPVQGHMVLSNQNNGSHPSSLRSVVFPSAVIMVPFLRIYVGRQGWGWERGRENIFGIRDVVTVLNMLISMILLRSEFIKYLLYPCTIYCIFL